MMPLNELMVGVELEYCYACSKHPKFADLLMEEMGTPDWAKRFIRWHLDAQRADNDERAANGMLTAGKVLREEFMEVCEAVICEHDQKHAIDECNQAIAVCLRLKEEIMKEKPFGRDYYKEEV